MPSYGHLFAGGAERGADLVAYLESLGSDTGAERFRDIQARPIRVDPAASPHRGRTLFSVYCAQCHGARGRGEGPLAAVLGHQPALDLGRGSMALVSFGPGIGTFDQGLARVVRFGMPGTSMPGHEHLDDLDLSALVAHVRAIASAPGGHGSAR
jgi:cytochrome c oxidase cbb3-type subunit 2